jgi:uncharacterized membrane protein YkvA (DUF1232 family)
VDREYEKLADQFDDGSFWKKMKRISRRAGRAVIEKVLVLYYCLQDPDTPAWAKRVIMGALAYFVLPIDAVPDIVPFAGFADDFGVLVSALAMVVTHIKPLHREQAEEKVLHWFGARHSPESHA